MQHGRRTVRGLRLIAVAFVVSACAIWAFVNVTLVTATWEFDDINAYLGAAGRLVDGKPLYETGAGVSETYLYAPWFAFLWVPLLALPRTFVEVGWAAILIASMLAAILPFRRTWSGVALALLLGALLYRTAGWGNVQPLLIAGLVYLLPTRAGPWMIGVASSLKPWPLLAVAVFAWRRQWASVAISLGVAGLLWLPVLLFNWRDYPLGARAPNLYDATFLLALPGLIAAGRPEMR